MGGEEKTVTMVMTTKSTAQGTIIKILNKLLPEDVQSNDLNLSQLQRNMHELCLHTLYRLPSGHVCTCVWLVRMGPSEHHGLICVGLALA